MSKVSVSNNYNTPLPAGASFVGTDENTSFALTISVFVASPTLGLVTIKQSNSVGGPYQLTDTFNYGTVDTMEVYRVPRGFSWFHVEFTNAEGNQTYLSLNTYLDNVYQETGVTIDGGTVSVTNVVDVSGNVGVTTLINETTATRPVYLMSIGRWYRVATVGNTSGAVWNAIGAIVGGESSPAIGRLFKCLSVPSNIGGQGTVYDVEYTDTPVVSGSVSVSSLPAITGTVAVSSQPNLSYLTDNVAVATMPAITGTVAVSSQPHLSYLTDNVAVATMPAITGTVAVSSQPHLSYLTDNVAVATQPALAFSTDKVDVTGSSVIVSSMPTTLSYRTTSAGNTGLVVKASAGIVARIYISNYDTTNQAFLFVRLYDKATAPTDADTPLCCFDLPHRGNSGSDSRIMLDLDNLAFTNGLGIRATTGSNANNDVVVTGLASDITILYK
jgi:hypothetical protein